jgi:acetate kinase
LKILLLYIPKPPKLFALPKIYAQQGVIRYGFHGFSYQYIADILPNYAGKKSFGKVMVAHLGSGASICAMQNLQSFATTMAMTPYRWFNDVFSVQKY